MSLRKHTQGVVGSFLKRRIMMSVAVSSLLSFDAHRKEDWQSAWNEPGQPHCLFLSGGGTGLRYGMFSSYRYRDDTGFSFI